MRLSPSRAGWLLIAISGLLRLAWCSVLEPSNDESYHWLYAVHPALSYFDHPPMTMVVERIGLALCGGWVHPLSLRLGFVLLFAGSTWAMSRWAGDLFGERAGFLAAALLNLSGYYSAFGGTFALPDSPFLFFAIVVFWRASRAVQSNSILDWFWVGLGFAGAMASKYHAVLLPGGVVLFALLNRPHRKLLWSPGPYLAVAMGFVGFLPVLVWNAQHDWASFRFQGGRAASSNAIPFLHEGPLKWLGGPVLYLLPWVWFWLVVVLVRNWRNYRTAGDATKLLLCSSLVPLAFFFVISGLSRGVLLHWPLFGFLPLYPLFGEAAVHWRDRYPKLTAALAVTWILGFAAAAGFILLQARCGVVDFPQGSKDPSADIAGWESVATELDRLGITSESNAFLFTNLWYDSGQLAFATRNRRPVVCYHAFDARGFAFWSDPAEYVGKTGYLVMVDDHDEATLRREYGPYFERIELAANFRMMRCGRPFRPVTVYRCTNQIRPYPFANKKSS